MAKSKAAKGAKKSAAAKKKSSKSASGCIDRETREAFVKGDGVPMHKGPQTKRDLMEGISIQRPADPYIPSPGSVHPEKLVISDPEISREMAPTAACSLIDQFTSFNEFFAMVFRQSAIIRALYETQMEPGSVMLKDHIDSLEELASCSIQLRNSLATHYYRQ